MKTLASISAALAIAACAATAAEPSANWGALCASCHGKDGAGHTKPGRKLGVKDLTDAAYQKTFTDDELIAALKTGLKAPDGTEKMKPFSEKISDDEIKALVPYIRAMVK